MQKLCFIKSQFQIVTFIWSHYSKCINFTLNILSKFWGPTMAEIDTDRPIYRKKMFGSDWKTFKILKISKLKFYNIYIYFVRRLKIVSLNVCWSKISILAKSIKYNNTQSLKILNICIRFTISRIFSVEMEKKCKIYKIKTLQL